MELNQAGVACTFGITNATMDQYIIGKDIPTVEMLAKIIIGSQELDLIWVTLDWLVFEKEHTLENQIIKDSYINSKYDILPAKIFDI